MIAWSQVREVTMLPIRVPLWFGTLKIKQEKHRRLDGA